MPGVANRKSPKKRGHPFPIGYHLYPMSTITVTPPSITTPDSPATPDAAYLHYLAKWRPYTDTGHWPADHRYTSGRIPSDITPLHIATDGSHKNNAVAWSWIHTDSHTWEVGATLTDPDPNSYAIEAYAILAAITATPADRPLHLYTDVQTLVHAYHQFRHTLRLPRNRADDILATAVELSKNRDIELHWVRGHNTHAGNRVADRLARWGTRHLLEETPHDLAEAEELIRMPIISTVTESIS